MALNVVVCVKQIPDPADPGSLDSDFTLNRSGKLILDESDMYGVEMGLQLAEAAGGGEVTLVSMAPDGKVDGLRQGLAMGAGKAILVSDEALAGSDALGTAKVLAGAIGKVEGADLILTATESSVINNTMLIQIAVLAWVFLGESLGARQMAGLLLALLGTLVVQLRSRPRVP